MQFNIAELCFLTGNYETAATEFKNLAQTFAVCLLEEKQCLFLSQLGDVHLLSHLPQSL